MKKINEIFYIPFSHWVYKIWCVFYTYSTSHFRLITFQVINSHLWLMEIVQESKYVDHFYLSFEKLNPGFFSPKSLLKSTSSKKSFILNNYRIYIYSQHYAILCLKKSPTQQQMLKIVFWISKYMNEWGTHLYHVSGLILWFLPVFDSCPSN